MLRAEVDGQVRKLTLDYLWDSDDGPFVVDVVRAERAIQSSVAYLCAWTRGIVESLGWSYQVVGEPPLVRLANVRYVAGYRREWLLNQDVLREMRSCSEQFAGMSIADAERIFVEFARPLIRPALMHLLWRHEFRVDLHEPLSPFNGFGGTAMKRAGVRVGTGTRFAYDGEVVTVVELHLVDGVLDLADRSGGHGTKALRADCIGGGVGSHTGFPSF